jgi:hypothetical protein
MPETKVCKGPCQLEKPLDEFRRHAQRRDGRDNVCKVCAKEADKRRRNAWKDPTPDERYKEGFDAGARAALTRLACLDADMLKEAAALTHPDRQPPERRDQAERVTAVLLAARDRLR